MRLSTRGRYAVMAMTELARRGSPPGGPPSTLAGVAAAQGLSMAYLEQLFGRLRRAGLVASARGPGGGYRLARPARNISVAEVVEAVDDTISRGPRAVLEPGVPPEQRDLWAELGRQVRHFLSAVSIEDVAQGRILGRAVAIREATAEIPRPEPVGG